MKFNIIDKKKKSMKGITTVLLSAASKPFDSRAFSVFIGSADETRSYYSKFGEVEVNNYTFCSNKAPGRIYIFGPP